MWKKDFADVMELRIWDGEWSKIIQVDPKCNPKGPCVREAGGDLMTGVGGRDEHTQVPRTCDCCLIWQKSLCCCWLRWCHLSSPRWALNPVTSVLIGEGRRKENRHTGEGAMWRRRERVDWRCLEARKALSHQKLEEVRNRFSPQAFGGSTALPTFQSSDIDLSFLASGIAKRINVYFCFELFILY